MNKRFIDLVTIYYQEGYTMQEAFIMARDKM